MESEKEISTELARFRLMPNGLIECETIAEGTGDMAEAIKSVNAMAELCEDGAKPLLVRMSDNPIEDDARVYLLENIHVSMVALIGVTFMARMMANLLLNFKKLPVPMRLFGDEESALNWIEKKNEELKALRA